MGPTMEMRNVMRGIAVSVNTHPRRVSFRSRTQLQFPALALESKPPHPVTSQMGAICIVNNTWLCSEDWLCLQPDLRLHPVRRRAVTRDLILSRSLQVSPHPGRLRKSTRCDQFERSNLGNTESYVSWDKERSVRLAWP